MNQGRRFWLVVGCSVTYTLLFVFGKLDASAYETMQIMTVGAYLAANGVQKFTDKKYGNGSSNKRPD